MKKGKWNLRVKGFTLTELIVVLAIMGILIAILGPTMTTYYRKSRVKDANTDAKMIYNASQTAAQSYISRDRVRDTADKSLISQNVIISYNGTDGTIQYTTVFGDAMTTVNTAGGTLIDDDLADLVESVNRTVSDAQNTNWAIYVQNYIVKGAISANSPTTNVVGYFSANKAQADDVSDRNYDGWLSTTADGSAVPDCLEEVCQKYDTP